MKFLICYHERNMKCWNMYVGMYVCNAGICNAVTFINNHFKTSSYRVYRSNCYIRRRVSGCKKENISKNLGLRFLDAAMHLCKRACLSVRP